MTIRESLSISQLQTVYTPLVDRYLKQQSNVAKGLEPSTCQRQTLLKYSFNSSQQQKEKKKVHSNFNGSLHADAATFQIEHSDK